MWDVNRTGGVRVLFELANRLNKRGHNVTITTLGTPGLHNWFPLEISEVIYAEQKIYRTNGKSASSIIKNAFEIVPDKFLQPFGVIRDGLRSQAVQLLADSIPKNADINVATLCFSAFSVNKSKVGIPFYYLQHYEPILFDDSYTKHWIDKTYSLPLKKIANSSWLKTLIKERFGLNCYGPIIPGIDHQIFHRQDVAKCDSEIRIVALGKSLKWKGLADLFEALIIARNEIPNIKLILYGSEPYLKNNSPVPCEYRANISDVELADLYSTADVVVTPSWYESSPLPPLEAMACGAPVITTKYGTEDYCFNEKNCLVVSPRNPQALGQAIVALLKNEKIRENFRREGPATAKKFTWEKATDDVEKLFQEATKNVDINGMVC